MRNVILAAVLAFMVGAGGAYSATSYFDDKKIEFQSMELHNLQTAWVSMCKGSNVSPEDCRQGWVDMVLGR